MHHPRIEQEARLASERITGEWYCMAGAHWTTAPVTTRNGRRVCKPCRDRIAAMRKQQRRSSP